MSVLVDGDNNVVMTEDVVFRSPPLDCIVVDAVSSGILGEGSVEVGVEEEDFLCWYFEFVEEVAVRVSRALRVIIKILTLCRSRSDCHSTVHPHLNAVDRQNGQLHDAVRSRIVMVCWVSGLYLGVIKYCSLVPLRPQSNLH